MCECFKIETYACRKIVVRINPISVGGFKNRPHGLEECRPDELREPRVVCGDSGLCDSHVGHFSWHNQVHFGFGIAMAVFQSFGAVLGVRFATRVPNANLWIHRLLIVILIAAATKIFLF